MTAPSPRSIRWSSKPAYAVSFNGRGSAYENRREGDRIIQEANQPIRNNQYNAYAYSPDTFPPVSPPVADASRWHPWRRWRR